MNQELMFGQELVEDDHQVVKVESMASMYYVKDEFISSIIGFDCFKVSTIKFNSTDNISKSIDLLKEKLAKEFDKSVKFDLFIPSDQFIYQKHLFSLGFQLVNVTTFLEKQEIMRFWIRKKRP